MTVKNKDRAHIRYKLADGTRVPGVTTITGVMAKPFLVPWANRLGLDGIDTASYVDSLADAGTLVHQMVGHDLGGPAPFFDEYSRIDKDLADNAWIKYLDWRKFHMVDLTEPHWSELPLVSEQYKYGGTIDFYGRIDDNFTLLDIKTGKAIYDDMWTQVAAYWHLLSENGFLRDTSQSVYILRIGRDEREGDVDYRPIPDLALHLSRFLICKRLYDINKQIKG